MKRKQRRQAISRKNKTIKEYKAMTLPCGCCNVTMYFYDKGSTEAALRRAEKNNTHIIIDDLGIEHNIDTYFGVWRK